MQVKIGMNMLLWGTAIDTRHISVFEDLAAAGFDGVEIPVATQDEATLSAMAAACDALSLERTASAFVGPDTNPIDPSPAVRAAARDNLCSAIDKAGAIGAQILIGGIYQAHKYFTGTGATEQEWQWCVEYLQACGEYAAGQGIDLGLEVLNRFEVFLVNTCADAQRLVADVGLSNVGIHYDTHHANIEEPAPSIALGHCGTALKHIHLSESHRGTLGTGQVDWDANFAAFKEHGYSGWLVIEAFGTSDAALATAANVWRNAFASESEVYEQGIHFIRERL